MSAVTPDTIALGGANTATGLPYKFLDYYKEIDEVRFAGRENDITEVVARATAERTFVLYGRSGLGKTSLILAGVFPQLRKRGFRPILVRLLESPLIDLRNATAADLGQPSTDACDDLESLIAAAAATAPAGVILVFDQFEEFFIHQRQSAAERRAFIQRLAALLQDPALPVRAFFSLREEYLAELDDFHAALPDIMRNLYRLRPLTAFGARQAIVAPLAQAGIAYDQRLVVRLVDLLAQFDFDSVLLQIACSEVYREAVSQNRQTHLTEADLDRVGGLDGLFERYLDNAIARVPEGQVLLSRAILDALITPEGTKRAVTLDLLLQNPDFRASIDEMGTVLVCLEQQRLVRREPRGSKVWYELAHERLVKSILAWFKRDADFDNFRNARDLIANATRAEGFQRRLETLLLDAQIRELITPYRQRLNLTPVQEEFMFWSAVYRCSADVDYWASRFGYEKCGAVLLALIAHVNVDARRAAAHAVAALGPKVEGLGAACLTAALTDPDPSVRRAAGRSLAAIATPADIAAIGAALREKDTRQAARELLTDFAEAGRPLDQFTRLKRWLIARHLRQRTLDRHRDVIRQRRNRGALVGLLTGLGWSMLVGVPLIAVIYWLQGSVDRLDTLTGYWIGVPIAAILLGWGLGWRLARADAQEAALRRVEGAWTRAIVRTVTLLVAILFGLMALSLIDAEDRYERAGVILVIGLWILLAGLLSGGLVRLARAAVWPRAGLTAIAAWGVLLSFGPLVLTALAIIQIATVMGHRDTELWLVVLVTATLCSFFVAIVALTLPDAATLAPIGTVPDARPRTRIVWRIAIAASCVASIAAYLHIYGRASIPLLAPRYTVPMATAIPFTIPAAHPQVAYATIAASDQAGTWQRVTSATTTRSVQSTRGLLELDQIVFVPASPQRLLAVGGADGTLRLDPVPTLSTGQALALDLKERKPFVLRLSRVSPKPGETQPSWRGEWHGRVTGTLEPTIAMALVALTTRGDGLSGTIALTEEARVTPTVVDYALPASLDLLRGAVQTAWETSRDSAAQARAVGVGQNPPRELLVPLGRDGTYRLTLTFQRADPLPPDRAFGITRPEGRLDSSASLPAAIDIPVDLSLRVMTAADYDARGTADVKAGHFEDAISEHRRAILLEPDNPTFLNNLAWALIANKDGRGALPFALRAVKLLKNPSPQVLDTLAHAEYLSGYWAEAAKTWELVYIMAPDHDSNGEPLCLDDATSFKDAKEKARTNAGAARAAKARR